MVFFSTIEPVFYLLPIVGFTVGVFGTILGGGGGFFFLPVLTLGLKVPAQTAVITTLVATLPICIVGSLGHLRKGNVNARIGMLLSLFGVIGAFVGAWVTGVISTAQLKAGFGIYTILIALNIVISTWREAGKTHLKKEKHKPLRMTKSGFLAFTAGIITGTFGTSGTAPILASLFNMRIPVKVVIGTSLLVVLTNTLFAISAHFLVSSIDLTLVGFLTIGSVTGAVIGPKLLAKSTIEKSGDSVKYIYAFVMAIIGILMITVK
ncbi:MAG: sulfite exporter TauE/SafE family protein [Cyclobacteriaceae bacterium]